ncbi:HAMP domain-containing sensor histidine kinase [Telmatospirillum sp.]|uniref:sensor histidine kinase n=1 Tax=Telmatospirillum sp. TaxID=2079197 RepID=UPI00284A9345|nr:HAMP domain-containing sensor histidine kinase [Telmatospirillum sp.]MDR3436880.1 HAMP domain-containing sensor histidine kinase [Telmatospirillum sp.]
MNLLAERWRQHPGLGGVWRVIATTTFRIAFASGLLFSLTSIGVLSMVRWSTCRLLDERADRAVEAEIDNFEQVFQQAGLETVQREVTERLSSLQARERVYLLGNADGAILAGNLDRWPDAEIHQGKFLVFDPTPWSDDDALQARGAILPLGNTGVRLLVGRLQIERLAFEQVVDRSIALSAGAGLVLGVLIGLFMARRTLSRLDAINRVTATTLRGDLAGRVRLTGSGDEFDQLAGNVNVMMDRIDRLVGAMQGVTRNIAHDLRTPLTRLRNRLEVALIAQCTSQPVAIEQTLTAALGDIDRLLATFAALLSIARIEGRPSGQGVALVPLAKVIDDAVDLYQPLAEDKGLLLTVGCHDADLVVNGDAHLVFQALVNLFDNAVKYCRSGDRITVSATRRDDGVELTVADNGPGIPEARRQDVLEPFVRLDADDRRVPGAGLGLSLVAAVAEFHRATLVLKDNQPGLKVVIGFPCDR